MTFQNFFLDLLTRNLSPVVSTKEIHYLRYNESAMTTLLFIAIGYLSGSLLFARIYPLLLHTKDSTFQAADHNPGAANAFTYGGFACGLFTLLGDLAKGGLPVYFFCLQANESALQYGLPYVLAAPVLGHLFPLYFHFQGGKGIAVTFGVFCGLWVARLSWVPLVTLIVLFLFFTLIIPVHPDRYLTMLVYLLEPGASYALHSPGNVLWGTLLISAVVLIHLAIIPEPRTRPEVRFLWKR